MAFDREKTKRVVATLATQGVLIGTSSWKYPGWRGLLYDESRYIWRGRYSEARLEKYCLTEYGQVFKTVCVDAAYYTFPSQAFLEQLVLFLQIVDQIQLMTVDPPGEQHQ